MVKFFGVIFLGQPREPALARAHDAGVLERIGLIWLALGCFALGSAADRTSSLRCALVVAQLTGDSLPNADAPWWLLVPLPGRRRLLFRARLSRRPDERRRAHGACTCGSSITGACAARRLGTAASVA